MFDAVFHVVADAEHHRRRRAQTDFVNCLHHVEPFLRIAFRWNTLANFIVQNLAAAAGKRIQTRRFQTPHNRFVIEFWNQRNVMNFRRRKTMQLKFWIFFVQCREQIFIPFDIKIGMKSALHQNTRAAECDCFINSFANFFNRMNVSIRFSRTAIKRAKCADDVANIGVIDVAVNNIRYNIARIFLHPRFVRGKSDSHKIFWFQKRGCVFGR